MQFSRTIIFFNVLFDGGECEINEKDEFDVSDHSGAQSVEPKEEKEKLRGGRANEDKAERSLALGFYGCLVPSDASYAIKQGAFRFPIG